MDAITTTRMQLDSLLREIEDREKAVAAAFEDLSQDAGVRAAFQQGGQAKERQVLFLIDCQMASLSSAGMSRGILTALRRQVVEAQS